MTLTSRFADYLYKGLGLVEPRIPTEIDDSVIQSVHDVYQNGHALVEYRYQVRNFIGPAPVQTHLFYPFAEGKSADNQFVLRQINVVNGTTAPAVDWDLNIDQVQPVNEQVSSAEVLRITASLPASGGSSVKIPAGTIAATEDLIGVSPILTPPGWNLAVNTIELNPGDTLTILWFYAKFPAGFNLGGFR